MAVNRTNGKQVGDPTKFPSGMAALAKYVHGQGLKFVRRLSPCSRLSPLSDPSRTDWARGALAGLVLRALQDDLPEARGELGLPDRRRPAVR